MNFIVTTDGYSIVYEKNKNKITIMLPPTMETVTDTCSLPLNRKVVFTDAELTSILYTVKMIVEGDNNLIMEKKYGKI